MSVQIGSVKSIGKTQNYSYNPDDRQELVPVIGGAVAVDGWGGTRSNTGDTVQFTATFSAADATTLVGYWNSRTLQNVTLEDGTTISSARVIVRRISYPDALAHRSKYAILDLEIWRV